MNSMDVDPDPGIISMDADPDPGIGKPAVVLSPFHASA